MTDIEDDVPVPERQRYPLAKLKLGQSFLLNYSSDRKLMALRARGAVSQVSKKHGMRFAVRVVAGGVRVWRTR